MLQGTFGQRFIFSPHKKALFILGIICILSTFRVSAQINVVYNQFFLNPYLYNPAYAGVEGHSVFFALYRQQWLNIQDAPAISNVNFHTPLKGGVGLGIMAFNESIGPLNTTWGKVSASYLVTVDRTHYLRFGLSVGGGTNTLDLGEIDSPTDPAFVNIAENSTYMIGDFGATYHSGHFNVGVSIPNLITYDAISTETMSPIRVSPLDNIMFKANYRGHLSDDVAIEPHVIYRYSDVGEDMYEGTLIFHLKHLIWAGATYRQDNNIIGLLGIKVAETFAVGYSYEMGNSNISNALGATHEVHIGWHLGSKKKHASHASSFIKSHRLSAEERARKAELERERKLAELRDSRPEGAEAVDPDALTIVPVAAAIIEQPNVERVNDFGEREKALVANVVLSDGPRNVVTWVPADTPSERWDLAASGRYRERTAMDGSKEVALLLTRTINGQPQQVVKWQGIDYDQELPEESAEVASQNTNDINPTAPVVGAAAATAAAVAAATDTEPEPAPLTVEEDRVDPDLTQDFRSIEELAASDEPLEVRKGTHLLELEEGNYVIAGSFEVFDNAERYSDRLFQRGYHDAKVGYVSARGYYYVVLFESDNVEAAQREKSRIKQRPGYEGIWVLKVNN
ncbi:MAG: PorP/SprF family type IX secretion system membrane protein [Bacteroidota bacterium]